MTPPLLLGTLAVLLACLLPAGGVAAADENKFTQTINVLFRTYNGEGITAWQIMDFNAQMHEGSAFDYKDFLAATVALVWDGTIGGNDLVRSRRSLRTPAQNEELNKALTLLDNPIVSGIDITCPAPPGWIPPIPEDGYTCQQFKTALSIEVDHDKLPEMYHPLTSALSAIELELAVGAHVQHTYMNAIDDGTMEKKLRYIEGGKGAMRILWDDPNLRSAWRKYGPKTEVDYGNAAAKGGGGGEETDVRLIVGSSIIGGVMFFFLLGVCVHGCAGNHAEKKAEKEGEGAMDNFDNENTNNNGGGGGDDSTEMGTAVESVSEGPKSTDGTGEAEEANNPFSYNEPEPDEANNPFADGGGGGKGDGKEDDAEEKEVGDLPPIT